MKRLIIISGITGAIGNAVLAQYATNNNNVIYGVSRSAVLCENFVDSATGKFPDRTFICSVGDVSSESYRSDYDEFIKYIDFDLFTEIVYVHALGVYPFEVSSSGDYVVSNDLDGDGIDDRCKFLTYDLFQYICNTILKSTDKSVRCAIFGSLADKYEPLVHSSWVKTIAKTVAWMKSVASNRVQMQLLNISSVICSHEIITRPYVFINTEADHSCWLTPSQVASELAQKLVGDNGGYHEEDIFNNWASFTPSYYQDRNFTKQKIAELFK